MQVTKTLLDSCTSILEPYLLPSDTMDEVSLFPLYQEFYAIDYPLFSFIFNFPWCAGSLIQLFFS